MKCNGCGNEYAAKISIRYEENGKKEEYCDKCGVVSIYNPDISFIPRGGYYDEHLGTHIYSKRQKDVLLKQKGWVEVGERINKTLGRPMPFIKDPDKRRKFLKDNFGAE